MAHGNDIETLFDSPLDGSEFGSRHLSLRLSWGDSVFVRSTLRLTRNEAQAVNAPASPYSDPRQTSVCGFSTCCHVPNHALGFNQIQAMPTLRPVCQMSVKTSPKQRKPYP